MGFGDWGQTVLGTAGRWVDHFPFTKPFFFRYPVFLAHCHLPIRRLRFFLGYQRETNFDCGGWLRNWCLLLKHVETTVFPFKRTPFGTPFSDVFPFKHLLGWYVSTPRGFFQHPQCSFHPQGNAVEPSVVRSFRWAPARSVSRLSQRSARPKCLPRSASRRGSERGFEGMHLWRFRVVLIFS